METSRLARLLVAALGGLSLALGVTGFAHADPTPGEIEKQIDDKWNTIEPLVEQHNQLKIQLASNQAKVKQLNDQIAPLKAQVDAAFDKVSAFAVMQYKTGRVSKLDAMLTTGSPDTFVDQMLLLNMVAKDEQSKIRDVITAKQQYEELKAPIDKLVAEQATQEKALASQETQINADIKNLQDMRMQAYGTGAGTGALAPVACPQQYDGSPGAKAAQFACKQIGKRYVWATEGPNTFDCSGLTMWSWKQVGVTYLRHYTMWQYEDTKRVSRSDLKPGDLVFFYPDKHHVGLYVGNGWMVHAPNPSKPVQMKKIDEEPISGYGRVA
ncbi:C40 family peptidase [Dactylosporangium vinaceum]|uniref:NlpC/P60 family protein n=1 Tax=Dactylosporangium vinaceum TaxID=53362 RepID=A0ABV5MPM9_9ACTN|nr:C40 family peptidase [Dactylosporangium vinaceum]UAB96736.1 C40 family peptidase [Dactylosporangium vinaceum]